MFGYGYAPPPEKPAKPTKPGIPTACIKKRDGWTYCDRNGIDEKKEFVFTDPGHAVRHYTTNKVLRACPECVEQCKDKIALMTAPMATQGIGGRK